jgi:hypothetical protein
MKLTIVVPDSMVYIDGKALVVDCSSLDPDIRAVQWDGDLGTGEIEHKSVGGGRLPNVVITDIARFQTIIDLWNAANAAVARTYSLIDYGMGQTIAAMLRS